MKATEIQIGDWVAIGSEYFKHYGMVRSVDAANAYVISWVTKNTERHPICALDPVPLTAEILEKNANGGFGNYDAGSRATYHIHQGKESVAVYVEWQRVYPEPYIELSGLGDTTYKGYCASVHTLQHALRLCGLETLADNFKV